MVFSFRLTKLTPYVSAESNLRRVQTEKIQKEIRKCRVRSTSSVSAPSLTLQQSLCLNEGVQTYFILLKYVADDFELTPVPFFSFYLIFFLLNALVLY